MLSPTRLVEQYNITLTQRQATLTTMALYFLGSLTVLFIELIGRGEDVVLHLVGELGGIILFGGTWIMYYKRNWEPARYIAVVAFTLLMTLLLPEPFVSEYAPMVIVIPIILALILTDSVWVIINALLTISVLLIRADGVGVYANPVTLTLFGMIVGGLLVRRLIEVTSLRQVNQVQEEIRQSEIRFRNLVENSSDEICILDSDGTLLYERPSSTPTLGYESREVLGSNFFQLIHTSDLERIRKILEDLLVDPSLHPRVQFRVAHRNNSWRWIEAVATNLLDEPSVHGIVINYHDVTERVEAEELLQRQLKCLSGLRQIDIAIGSSCDLNITLGIVLQQVSLILNVDACAVLLVNPKFLRAEYAASRGFQSGQLPPTLLSKSEGYASRVILERQIVHISNLMQIGHQSAETPYHGNQSYEEYYGAPLIVKGEVKGVLEIYHHSPLQPDAQWLEFLEMIAGQAAIAIENAQLFDSLQSANAELEYRVTERTAELNKTNAELERANRTKDEFLATMSHELRTPLNSIIGLSESLLEQRRGTLTDHQQKSLEIIESSGKHLLELINDILDLSKIEAKMFDFYPQIISLDEFCRSCMAFVRAQAVKKCITITYIPEPLVSKIYADPRRLKQILVNLLTNAVKFTSENGHVTLRITADTEGETVSFSVMDNGIGIAEKDLKRLFQPFMQLDSRLSRQYEGTGLGLSLVQKLTDLHGGSVTVVSDVGKGSCFTVNIPYKLGVVTKIENIKLDFDVSLQDSADTRGDSSVETRTFGSILLAEDNMASILAISEYLESYGYAVVVAHDGLEAVQTAEEINPDLILMDIQMPALSGLDAIARLRSNPLFQSTPIIALTALAMPGDRQRCLLAGATEYTSKPVSLKFLKQMIESFLEHHETA